MQNLKTENSTLKSPKDVISLDLDKIDRMVKNCHYPHNKSGIGYKRGQSYLRSNSSSKSRSKEKHTQNSNNSDKRSFNYAFRYRYNNKNFKDNRIPNNSQGSNKNYPKESKSIFSSFKR